MATPKVKTTLVVLDVIAMAHISDIAHTLFMDSSTHLNPKQLMFQALHDYLIRLGIKPQFKVEIKK